MTRKSIFRAESREKSQKSTRRYGNANVMKAMDKDSMRNFMRVRENQEMQAKKRIDTLNTLMSKRMDREQKALEKFND